MAPHWHQQYLHWTHSSFHVEPWLQVSFPSAPTCWKLPKDRVLASHPCWSWDLLSAWLTQCYFSTFRCVNGSLLNNWGNSLTWRWETQASHMTGSWNSARMSYVSASKLVRPSVNVLDLCLTSTFEAFIYFLIKLRMIVFMG
jgi:hypothetical protein